MRQIERKRIPTSQEIGIYSQSFTRNYWRRLNGNTSFTEKFEARPKKILHAGDQYF